MKHCSCRFVIPGLDPGACGDGWASPSSILRLVLKRDDTTPLFTQYSLIATVSGGEKQNKTPARPLVS